MGIFCFASLLPHMTGRALIIGNWPNKKAANIYFSTFNKKKTKFKNGQKYLYRSLILNNILHKFTPPTNKLYGLNFRDLFGRRLKKIKIKNQ